MAKHKRKFSRKEMKRPDEFLQKSWEIGDWVTKHARQIAITVGGIVLLIFIVMVIFSIFEWRKVKSSRALKDVFEISSKRIIPTQYTPGAEESVEDNDSFGSKHEQDEALFKSFKKARDNANTSSIKKTATLGIASSLLRLKRYREAITEYRKLLDDLSGMESFQHFIYEGLGFAYEGAGRKQEAIKAFKSLETCQGGKYRELALYHLARIYESLGKKDEARKLRQEIVKKINEAKELTPLYAYLQEKLEGEEGVDFTRAGFFGKRGSAAENAAPELLKKLKDKLDRMKKERGKEENKAVNKKGGERLETTEGENLGGSQEKKQEGK